MVQESGHYKAIKKAMDEGVFKRGQNAEVTVSHRHGCRSHWHPSCDCNPRVRIKTEDNGTDKPTVVNVVHKLTDGRTITTGDGVKSVSAYDGNGNVLVKQY